VQCWILSSDIHHGFVPLCVPEKEISGKKPEWDFFKTKIGFPKKKTVSTAAFKKNTSYLTPILRLGL